MATLFRETLPGAALRPRAFGGAGTLINGGTIDDLDANSALRGDLWYGTPYNLGIADKMIRDAHVAKSLHYITGPLRAASWDFEPASNEPIDREIA